MVENLSLPDSYKNHEMCNKGVENYSYYLEFVRNAIRLEFERFYTLLYYLVSLYIILNTFIQSHKLLYDLKTNIYVFF